MININIVYNNDFEDCGYRLSATSRAFCETHNVGSEWYESIPVFDFEKMAEINNKAGDALITSSYKFIKPLYVSFTFSYEDLKRKWEELIANAPKEYKGLPVKIEEFPSEEELKKEVIAYFKEKYTKTIKIIDNGELFAIFAVPNTQKFSFEKGEGIDNFEEFEEFLKSFYNLKDVSLAYPKESENSPVYYWGDEVENYLVEIDGFTFLKKSFIDEKQKKEEEKALNSAKNIINNILNANDIKELDWRYTPNNAEKIIKEWKFDELKADLEKAKAHYQNLKDNGVKKELEEYIKNAEDFLNKLYVIDNNIEEPDAPSSAIIDPDYYYSNSQKAQKAKEELIEKFKDVFLKANKLYLKIKNDIEYVYSKAGYFYANKEDKVWNVKVPAEKKGLFIGKGGANIKALAKKYGVKINTK